MKTMKELNQQVRDSFAAKKGGVAYKCFEASVRLERLARTNKHSNVVHYTGFFSSQIHNWCLDTQSGIIYDPTMEQFGLTWSGQVTPDNPIYKKYWGTPQAEVQYWAPSMASYTNMGHLARYFAFKQKSGGKSEETRGEFVQPQLKVSKKGDEYLLFQKKVHFTVLDGGPQMRSCLVFKTKDGRGYNVRMLMQRMVMLEDRVIYPTSIKTYYLAGNCRIAIPKKRDKWEEKILVHGDWRWQNILEAIQAHWQT